PLLRAPLAPPLSLLALSGILVSLPAHLLSPDTPTLPLFSTSPCLLSGIISPLLLRSSSPVQIAPPSSPHHSDTLSLLLSLLCTPLLSPSLAPLHNPYPLRTSSRSSTASLSPPLLLLLLLLRASLLPLCTLSAHSGSPPHISPLFPSTLSPAL